MYVRVGRPLQHVTVLWGGGKGGLRNPPAFLPGSSSFSFLKCDATIACQPRQLWE